MSQRPSRPQRQADRTRADRHALYSRIGLADAKAVLDVGCGAGEVTKEIVALSKAQVTGLDVNPQRVQRATALMAGHRRATILAADAHQLPFEDATFDVTLCHVTLMWVAEPAHVVAEMARVTRPGGLVAAVMEPDYGGTIHHPENPVADRLFADDAIRRRGGDPHMGRKLRALFANARLDTEVGLLNPKIPSCAEDLETYRQDGHLYRKWLLGAGMEPKDVDAWQAEYEASLRAGTQFSFLPLFYAIGRHQR